MTEPVRYVNDPYSFNGWCLETRCGNTHDAPATGGDGDRRGETKSPSPVPSPSCRFLAPPSVLSSPSLSASDRCYSSEALSSCRSSTLTMSHSMSLLSLCSLAQEDLDVDREALIRSRRGSTQTLPEGGFHPTTVRPSPLCRSPSLHEAFVKGEGAGVRYVPVPVPYPVPYPVMCSSPAPTPSSARPISPMSAPPGASPAMVLKPPPKSCYINPLSTAVSPPTIEEPRPPVRPAEPPISPADFAGMAGGPIPRVVATLPPRPSLAPRPPPLHPVPADLARNLNTPESVPQTIASTDTKGERKGAGRVSTNGGCKHTSKWRRLRVKKGMNHVLCMECGFKWRCPVRPGEVWSISFPSHVPPTVPQPRIANARKKLN